MELDIGENSYSDELHQVVHNGTVSWNKDIPHNGQWDMGHLQD